MLHCDVTCFSDKIKRGCSPEKRNSTYGSAHEVSEAIRVYRTDFRDSHHAKIRLFKCDYNREARPGKN